MEIAGITIISVPVSDPDRAKTFYTDVLGFTVVEDEPMGPEMRWLRLTPPGGGTAISLVTWFATMPAGSLKGTVYAVADLEAVAAELADQGVATANGIESAPWGRYLQLDDPDGNGIVLQEDTAG